MIGRQLPIRKNDYVHAILNGFVRFLEKGIKRGFEIVAGAVLGIRMKEDRKGGRIKSIRQRSGKLVDHGIGNKRRFELDHTATFRARLGQITLRSDKGYGRSDDFLANRIDRRISNLCKQLLEVIVNGLGFFGKYSQGNHFPSSQAVACPIGRLVQSRIEDPRRCNQTLFAFQQ